MKIKLLLATVLLVGISSVANAACYEQRYVDGPLTCTSKHKGKGSADFTGGCFKTPVLTNVEIACPTPAPTPAPAAPGGLFGYICGQKGTPACPSNDNWMNKN